MQTSKYILFRNRFVDKTVKLGKSLNERILYWLKRVNYNISCASLGSQSCNFATNKTSHGKVEATYGLKLLDSKPQDSNPVPNTERFEYYSDTIFKPDTQCRKIQIQQNVKSPTCTELTDPENRIKEKSNLIN